MFFYFVYGFKNQHRKFLWLDKTFVCCSPLWFYFPQGTRRWRDLTRRLFLLLVAIKFPFAYRYKIYNRVLITKTALTKLLENTLDERSKLKNMSDERLRCSMKSLLSQNFYRTMPGQWPHFAHSMWQSNFFVFRRLKTTLNAFFINSTFTSSTRLRFNPK